MRTYPKTQCAGCCRYFSTTGTFDEHRTGRFDRRPSERRCMTEPEMLAAGLEPVTGMITGDQSGKTRTIWLNPSKAAAARAAFAKRPTGGQC